MDVDSEWPREGHLAGHEAQISPGYPVKWFERNDKLAKKLKGTRPSLHKGKLTGSL